MSPDFRISELIDLHDAARLLGVRYYTVRHLWVARKGLRAVRLGKRWYTTERWLNAFSESGPDLVERNDGRIGDNTRTTLAAHGIEV